jgi:serine/threonine-protein kinase HipA
MPKQERSSEILNVYLNDIFVGNILLLPDERTIFTFDESYVNDQNRPTLSLAFKTPLGGLRTEDRVRNQSKLPPFFSNLLPEGYLRDYFSRKLNISSHRETSLLLALGSDLPGAVRVTSDFTAESSPSKMLPSSKFLDFQRFSLAGVQPKFTVSVGPTGEWQVPPFGTGGDWILKLPSRMFDHIPESEYSLLRLAQKVGLRVPEFQLTSTEKVRGLPDDVMVGKSNSLLVKRFDRGGEQTRIHMEDFAQVFNVYPEQKYEKASFDRLGYVILTEAGEDDFTEYVRRLVFTILTGNGDMHLKNWSLLYKNGINPKLSPVYDLVPTIVYIPGDKLALKLGGEKEFKQIIERNFLNLANKVKASENLVLDVVRDTVEKTITSWQLMRKELPLSEEAKNIIELHMTTCKLVTTKFLISLPVLNLKLNEVARFEENLLSADSANGGERKIFGYSYLFKAQMLASEAKNKNETLDQFLTRAIASGFYKTSLRGKVLVMFSQFAEQTFSITVTSKTNAVCGWLNDIPGCISSERAWAPDNAGLYIYWDGSRVHRIYDFRMKQARDETFEDPDDFEYYVSDLGAFNPPFVSRTNSENYTYVQSQQKSGIEYSAVPVKSPEVVLLNGSRKPIYHTFIRFIR